MSRAKPRLLLERAFQSVQRISVGALEVRQSWPEDRQEAEELPRQAQKTFPLKESHQVNHCDCREEGFTALGFLQECSAQLRGRLLRQRERFGLSGLDEPQTQLCHTVHILKLSGALGRSCD
jgi:hypothetical protein